MRIQKPRSADEQAEQATSLRLAALCFLYVLVKKQYRFSYEGLKRLRRLKNTGITWGSVAWGSLLAAVDLSFKIVKAATN